MSPSKACHSFWHSVSISNKEAQAESREQQTSWSASKGGNRVMGSRNEVIWETAGRSRDKMKVAVVKYFWVVM